MAIQLPDEAVWKGSYENGRKVGIWTITTVDKSFGMRRKDSEEQYYLNGQLVTKNTYYAVPHASSSDYQIIENSNAFLNVTVRDGGNGFSIYSNDTEDSRDNYYSSYQAQNGDSKVFRNSLDDNDVYFHAAYFFPMTITISYKAKGEMVSAKIKLLLPNRGYTINIKPL